jgi:hypothetical protein
MENNYNCLNFIRFNLIGGQLTFETKAGSEDKRIKLQNKH